MQTLLHHLCIELWYIYFTESPKKKHNIDVSNRNILKYSVYNQNIVTAVSCQLALEKIGKNVRQQNIQPSLLIKRLLNIFIFVGLSLQIYFLPKLTIIFFFVQYINAPTNTQLSQSRTTISFRVIGFFSKGKY